jgi:hypothetical protein
MLDQICCRWWRTNHMTLKPDIYFWNKWNGVLQLFYRRQKSKDRSKLEVFVNGARQPLHNALVPFYKKKFLELLAKKLVKHLRFGFLHGKNTTK